MPEPASSSPHDPYAALRVRNYRDYLGGSFMALLGRQAVVAAATWEVYQWTHSATALGLVGLANVLPLLALSLPAGVIADRHDRRKLIALGTAGIGIINVALAALSFWHATVPDASALSWANAALEHIALVFEKNTDVSALRFDQPALPLIYLLLFAQAIARILIWPARSSIAPLLVPTNVLGNAITWSTSAFEIATVAGPALGGFLIWIADVPSVYALGGALELVFLLALRRITYFQPPQRAPGGRSWGDVLAGAKFIWRRKLILGASSLDLFAVLLGGATALLPIYADRILHVGPVGFGWLRAAPSIGAFAMAMARPPPAAASPRLGPLLVRRRLRRFHHRLRPLAVVLALVHRALFHRRLRQRQRRHPAIDAAVAHARCAARPRDGREPDLHRLLE